MVAAHLQITERNDVVNGVEGLAYFQTKGEARNHVITPKNRMMSGTKESIP
jgi:hypothetical protein